MSERDTEARMQALQRELLWHRRILVAAALLVAGCALSAARSSRPAEEIRAKRFVLTDSRGTVRAVLETDAAGTAALRMLGAGGTDRLVASVAGEVPSVVLSSAIGKSAASLTVEGGVPRLALVDNAGRDRMWVALRLGSPTIQFLAVDGKARTGLATMNDDTGVVVISDASGPVPGLALYDKDRKIVWSAP